MASIHPPYPSHLTIEYYLEDHIDTVLEATPLQITYKAWDHDAALIATSALIAHGLKAQFYPVPHHNHVSWHVHAHT
jgi:hypothetical protein